MNPRSIFALLVAALTIAFAGIALAQGQTVEIATQVKLNTHAPSFHGKVTADNPGCIEDRKVKMFFRYGNGQRKLLGSTTAANNGKWKIPVTNIASGEYYAVAKRTEQGTAGTIYVCLKAKSNSLVAD
jgi:hypothetical protein